MSELRTILLLRHGQTASNAGGVIQGHLPVPLNDLGHQQAEKLAQRLTKYDSRPQIVITSDLVRAMQTARPVAAALRIPLIPDPVWRERNMGEFQGKTVGDRRLWMAVAGDIETPGAESRLDFRNRAVGALNDLLTRFPGKKRLAVVTHGGPIRMILQALVDGDLPLVEHQEKPPTPEIINCSILRLDRIRNAWSVGCVNDAAHLDIATGRDVG